MTSVTAVFASAARSFASLVRDIPADRWDGPGLGDWDLRALVSHTSRSLVTVISYLQVTAEHEDVTSGQEYYAWVRDYVRTAGRDAIVERGRQAGRELGEDPVAAIDALVERVLGELTTVGDPLIAVIGGLGIRLSVYLRTRSSNWRCTASMWPGRPMCRSRYPMRCSRTPSCWRPGSDWRWARASRCCWR